MRLHLAEICDTNMFFENKFLLRDIVASPDVVADKRDTYQRVKLYHGIDRHQERPRSRQKLIRCQNVVFDDQFCD